MTSYRDNLKTLLERWDSLDDVPASTYAYRRNYHKSYEILSKQQSHGFSYGPMKELVLGNGVKVAVRLKNKHREMDGGDYCEFETVAVDWGFANDEHQRLVLEMEAAKIRLEEFEEQALAATIISREYVKQ